ncbi:MAG: hypothetical protein K8J08_21990 [Thermoanaerobaculia bacterium]|nr:hypothetical protein [Thermoanaerobaculia bacterium]
MSVHSALRALVEPIPQEKKRLLAERWSRLDDVTRVVGQGFGRQATGCGATIGVMPRCDFDCRGCYLGEDANAMTRRPLREILVQIDRLREYLGPKGNLQVTDGEVTLLPTPELIAIVQHAHSVGLLPMVMTHGDSFRRQPELLTRLVSEGGLTEVSIHVDCLQRGRRGDYRGAITEAELMPLRDEFAAMVRDVRCRTGVRLRAATTLTVSRDNLDEVADVVRWAFDNRDAFGLISMQSLAKVGRTQEDQLGVSSSELWEKVAEALAPFGFDGSERTPLQLGHPECTRMEPFAVYRRRGEAPRLVPVVRAGSEADSELVEDFFRHGLGGLNFRDDPLGTRICRGAGLLFRAPQWFLGYARRWVSGRCRDLGTSLTGLAWDAMRGTARVSSFMVVSHHFMDSTQLSTELGAQRLGACVFRVPVGDEMMPMCRVNADGGRDVVYSISPPRRKVHRAGGGEVQVRPLDAGRVDRSRRTS